MRTPYNGLLPQALSMHNISSSNILNNEHVIEDKKIENYQLVVPTTWNASPRDVQGKRSAYEESLIGTPVADPKVPLEVLRTIHSFDPCLACAVHVYDENGTTIHDVKTY